MRYFIIAGEISGDKHGADLVRSIIERDTDATIWGCGGDAMQEAGVHLVRHIRETAFMGFAEVVTNIQKIRKNFDLVKSGISKFDPDVIVFIDYPGFNLRMAAWAKSKNYKTVYYIPPKVWAWKESRVQKIKKYIDRVLVIFPFEVEYYKKHDIEATYVGNPSKNTIDTYREEHTPMKLGKPILAVFPGSRKQEIKRMMQILSEASVELESRFSIVIAGIRSLGEHNYPSRHKVVYDDPYSILHASSIALVKSGTSTLETALFSVPQVVCYRTSSITYAIAKRFVNIPYISLPNILLNKPLVPELIQDDMNINNICSHLISIHMNPSHQLEGYKQLHEQLGSQNASDMAAREIFNIL